MATTDSPPDATTLAPPRPSLAVPWAALLGAAAVGLAYLPLLLLHWQQVWLRPHYGFLPFALLGACVLAVVRCWGQGELMGTPVRGAGVLAVAAWGLLAGAELLYSPWLGAIAALTALVAVILGVGGFPLLRRLAPSLVLLCLAVPPPFELDRDLILALQRLTTAWSGSILDYLGVPHVMAGNVVEVSGGRLLVEEACSGIHSLLPVLTCTLFFVFLVRRRPVPALLLVVAAVGWALAANTARVVIVTCANISWGLDLTTGRPHDAVGFGLFALVLALVWSTDKLLQFLAPPPATKPRPAAPNDGPREALRPRPWFAAWPCALAFLLLGAFHLWAYGGPVSRDVAASGSLVSVDEEAAPARCAGWERQGKGKPERRTPGSAFGEFSVVWAYARGGDAAVLSLDYPFPGWHDLTRCYTGQGWVIDEETTHDADGAEGPPGGYVEVRLSQPGRRSGYLLYCQFDGHGQALRPRPGGARLAIDRHETALRRLRNLASGTPETPPAEPAGPVYQLQLFCEGFAPPTPARQEQARALFAQGWRSLRQQWPE
jgi:exosortase